MVTEGPDVYEGGVLRPMENLPLAERQQVTLTISDPALVKGDLPGYFTPEEWAEAASDDISLDEVALTTISGSLSEAVIALRQER